ncbi:class I SAM-dependent methyltransferase [Campylobacter sp. MIT 97-5078]|uniref:class I SAM-dependent methyltransferase n=1 Tax=Campylobacter sp. MIT 97-5078 TaxID=1548153 RepID=UPI000512CACD|nr:class I SAM-dependent methyltransferase [Campylobacter sp. MIT 97-5078]KGI56242.1 hypothetical protein LR59_08305 [Campylobacter sp. MIT 97-5078]TQR27236.1 class I SAM-dependent methyltransferase [Campylobacter sp. MIT 97-5078]
MLKIFKKLRKRLRVWDLYIDKLQYKLEDIEQRLIEGNKQFINLQCDIKQEFTKQDERLINLECNTNIIYSIRNELTFIKILLQENSNSNSVFNSIYKNNYWGQGSGPGSNEQFCAGYVEFLQDFFKKYYIKSIVDCGCGDWQFSKNINFNGIDYKGFDVASFVVENNSKNYHKENIQFFLYDGDFSTLPSADLIICKDVLQHLPNAKIKEFIANLHKYKFALITNDIAENVNGDISLGGYRCLDLRKEPFNLNMQILYTLHRMPKAPDMPVMLWENKDLKA